MRYLPYVLVAFMAAPIVLWMLISKFMVQGTSNDFSNQDLWVLGSLGVFVVVAFFLLSTWLDKAITKMK